MMRLMKKREGFTLVELMVVVVIIGILIAIAIPIYGGIQARARRNACYANQRIIDGAIAMYYAEEGEYPATGTDGVAALVGAYLEATPECPGEGDAYALELVGAGPQVRVAACSDTAHVSYRSPVE